MVKRSAINAVSFLIGLYSQVAYSDYTFTAPPRESIEKGIKVYKPISDFLSQVTGEGFIYEHPDTWSEYSENMHSEKYDLVFDGPHFIDWRINNIDHEALVKLPQLFRWRIITRKDNVSISSLRDMEGKKTCAPGSPNFGMLSMLSMFSHFPNPDKQPVHIKIKGWINVYEAITSGKCDVGVLPKTNLSIYDKNNEFTKVIHTHLPYPNQGFTVSKRLPSQLRNKIRDTLLSEDGQEAMKLLRQRYAAGVKLVNATDEEYNGVRLVLQRADNFTYEKKSKSSLASN